MWSVPLKTSLLIVRKTITRSFIYKTTINTNIFSDIPRFLSEKPPYNKERFEVYKLKTK